MNKQIFFSHTTLFQSALYQTNTTVIDLEEAVLVCDPTFLPQEVETIKKYVTNLRRGRPLYLLFTHNDFDHIIGAGAFPEAIVIASKEFALSPKKQDILEEIQSFDQMYYLKRKDEVVYPEVDKVITEDGQQMKIGPYTLTFHLAPGHTPDGLFTFIEPAGIFLAGDYLSDVEFPFIEDSFLRYQQTLQKAHTLLSDKPDTLLVPGHGSATVNSQEIQKRTHFSFNYLEKLMNGDPSLEQELKKQYPFYEGIRTMHENNKKKIPPLL